MIVTFFTSFKTHLICHRGLWLTAVFRSSLSLRTTLSKFPSGKTRPGEYTGFLRVSMLRLIERPPLFSETVCSFSPKVHFATDTRRFTAIHWRHPVSSLKCIRAALGDSAEVTHVCTVRCCIERVHTKLFYTIEPIPSADHFKPTRDPAICASRWSQLLVQH